MSYSFPPYTTASGTTYTIATPGSITTPTITYTNGSSGLLDNQNLSPASLQVKGKAQFECDVEIQGDLAIQGKSIQQSLEAIEERLAILRPNEELEEKWEKLRGLRKMYMELEAEIIEKEKVWGILKK